MLPFLCVINNNKKNARLPQQTSRRRTGEALGSVGFRQGPHQVQLLALLVGVDGCSLVVVHQLVQCVELSLSDAVHVTFDVDAEVFVATGGFQRYRVVTEVSFTVPNQIVTVVAVRV